MSSAEAPTGTAAELPPNAELPNLRHLRLLDAAIERASLTLAAEAVHVSQPAASQAIAKLSRLFGARLLERAGNSVAPTEDGRIVAERARRALAHLRDTGRGPGQRNRLGRPATGEQIERYATMAQLRALATFAGTGSFSAAARRLGQTEPSVQRACREIERVVGTPLFEGSPRNMSLTQTGETIATQASLALKEIATAHAELRERNGVFDSQLVIGTLPLVRTRIVPDAVVALMERHPAARIRIIDGSYETLVQKVRFGSCDLLVGALRGQSLDQGLQETELFRDSLHVVARAGHPLAGRRVSGPELARFPWILPRPETPSRHVFDDLAANDGIADPARGYVETGSLVALRGILLASDSLTLISLRQVDYEIRQGLLVAIDFPIPPTDRAIGITTLSNWRPTALHSAFLECLNDQIATAPAARPDTGHARAVMKGRGG